MVRRTLSSPRQYAIRGTTGITGQIAPLERRLSGPAQNPRRPAVSVLLLAGIGYVGRRRQARSEQSFRFWAVFAWANFRARHVQSLNKINIRVVSHSFPSWHHFQVGFSFCPHHTFFMVTPWSVWSIGHVVRLTAVSLLFGIVFYGQISLFELFVVFKGGRSLPNNKIYTRCPCWLFINIWWQTVRQSKPNNRN